MKIILIITLIISSLSACTSLGTNKITDHETRSQIYNGMSFEEVKEVIGDKNLYNNPIELKPYWINPSERVSYLEYGLFKKNFFYRGDYAFFVFFDRNNRVIDSEYKKDIRPLPWITTKSVLEATFCPTYNPSCMSKNSF